MKTKVIITISKNDNVLPQIRTKESSLGDNLIELSSHLAEN